MEKTKQLSGSGMPASLSSFVNLLCIAEFTVARGCWSSSYRHLVRSLLHENLTFLTRAALLAALNLILVDQFVSLMIVCAFRMPFLSSLGFELRWKRAISWSVSVMSTFLHSSIIYDLSCASLSALSYVIFSMRTFHRLLFISRSS